MHRQASRAAADNWSHRGACAKLALAALLTSTLIACSAGDPQATSTSRRPVDLSMAEGGWGPDRTLFSHRSPPSRAVLNSVTDDPVSGDERSFLALREAGHNDWSSEQPLPLKAGGRYQARIEIHNDAPGRTSRGTRVAAQLPATVAGRERVSAIATSADAEPPAVWRSLVVTTSEAGPVALRIVPDSARLYTGRTPAGVALPAGDLFSDPGVLIGCDGPTGNLTGDSDCHAEVRFEFVADQPNFTISQLAAHSGTAQYQYALAVEPEDKVDIKIKYSNTGSTVQNDVVVKYVLPPDFGYVAGTTALSATSTNNEWTPVESDEITHDGINIGSYSPGGGAYLRITMQAAKSEVFACGTTRLSGKAVAETANGAKTQPLTLELTRNC
ncbi:hypothetical protein [Amycolatopsis benzoatilytica]|uniref:hypothetical protein n=1 Tax=Amycolatopsis benzoatilytica TaxID=346045 RepID=UPI000375432D|nr:hypothetical protein [Amycolatopsis benzoatilytica]